MSFNSNSENKCYLNDKLVTVDYVDTRACPPP